MTTVSPVVYPSSALKKYATGFSYTVMRHIMTDRIYDGGSTIL